MNADERRNNEWLTADQAAALCGMSTRTFWRWVADGQLPQPARLKPHAPRWSRTRLMRALERESDSANSQYDAANAIAKEIA
jgi:predicted DNA-binding transcriptional regulator AlpA